LSPLERGGDVEPLSDPVIERAAGGWRLRYAVVAWRSGAHRVALPPVWLIGPGGRADSLSGGAARVTVASVLPGSRAGQVEPRSALAPLRPGRRRPWAPVVALVLALAVLAAGWRGRRRPPRGDSDPDPGPASVAVPDARWLAAGEPRAVAARARASLRAALARVVPEAHDALGTEECLAVVGRVRPDLGTPALHDLLRGLDSADYGAEPAERVAGLAARARGLAREIVT
jgi:hypothetical protein